MSEHMNELMIDHGHDAYVVDVDRSKVVATLRSRGTFEVMIELSPADARAFAGALAEAAVQADANLVEMRGKLPRV